jgi:hypothetical protein
LSITIGLAGVATRANAADIVVPPGLQAGAEYRLVFVTVGGYAANDSTIADYNSSVTAEADSIAALLDLAATWTDIGSTPSIDAITNIGADPGIPIYGLDGTEIADDATTNAGGLFSGTLLSGIDVNPNGTNSSGGVWTGTNTNGTQASGNQLGTTSPIVGLAGLTSAAWVDFGTNSSGTTYLLYGILQSSLSPQPRSHRLGR